MNYLSAQEIKRRGISAVDAVLEKGPVYGFQVLRVAGAARQVADTEIDRVIGALPMSDVDKALRHTLGL